MVNFTLPSTTNEMISISTSQFFRSWVVIFHLRQPMAFFNSQLMRYARACSPYECFILRARRLSSKLLKQGYFVECLKSSFRKFYVDTGILFSMWSFPLTNVKWHSDPSPTVTSQPIRLSTNFMTLIPTLTFTESWVVSMEHLQRLWHASRERLPFRTPSSVPPFWDLLVLQLLRPDSSNLPCLYSTFHLE